MKYLVSNKVYDTDKSELILTYNENIEDKGVLITTYPLYKHSLYKTKKGNFFVHIGDYVGTSSVSYNKKNYIKVLTEKEVKKILNKLNEVDKYEELFGNLEEG